MQEAESAEERPSESEMKRILLSKLTPETKQKIKDSPVDKKVLVHWVQVLGLRETMTKMELRNVLNSVSAVWMKHIILREGQLRVEFHDSEGSEFFTTMMDGKVKFKGTVLRMLPLIFSYSVDQVWDQLEKYANLERQKAQDTKGCCTELSAVSNTQCAVCLFIEKDQRAATHSTADHRLQPSDINTLQSKVERKSRSTNKSPKRGSTEFGPASKGQRQRTVPRQEQRLHAKRLLATRRGSKRL